MKALVICPPRHPLDEFSQLPLPLIPVLGRPLIGHVLHWLAGLGATTVRVCASDRPELLRSFFLYGGKWGLKVDVFPVPDEVDKATCQARYDPDPTVGWLPGANAVIDLVSFFHLQGEGLRQAAPAFSELVFTRLARMEGEGFLGMTRRAPHVWVHDGTHVDPTAVLNPPCWIGAEVSIEANAVVGPNAVIESRSRICPEACVEGAWVGPATFVGRATDVKDSLAWGSKLLSTLNGSLLRITDADAFLLSGLDVVARVRPPLFRERLAAALLLLLTWPVLLVGLVRKPKGEPLFVARKAFPQGAIPHDPLKVVPLTLFSLNGAPGVWRRWPELWEVVRKRFHMAGNRPLSLGDAARLHSDMDQLWLLAPPGVFALTDALELPEGLDEETVVHAAYFSVAANLELKRNILSWAAHAALRPGKYPLASPPPRP